MIDFKLVEEKTNYLISKMLEKHPDMGLDYTIIPTLWSDGDFEIECRHAVRHDNGDATIYCYHYFSCEEIRMGLHDELWYNIIYRNSSELISYDELTKRLEKK